MAFNTDTSACYNDCSFTHNRYNIRYLCCCLRIGILCYCAYSVFILTRRAVMANIINYARSYNKFNKLLMDELDLPTAYLERSGYLIWYNNAFLTQPVTMLNLQSIYPLFSQTFQRIASLYALLTAKPMLLLPKKSICFHLATDFSELFLTRRQYIIMILLMISKIFHYLTEAILLFHYIFMMKASLTSTAK